MEQGKRDAERQRQGPAWAGLLSQGQLCGFSSMAHESGTQKCSEWKAAECDLTLDLQRPPWILTKGKANDKEAGVGTRSQEFRLAQVMGKGHGHGPACIQQP